jgi:hypothetical protein
VVVLTTYINQSACLSMLVASLHFILFTRGSKPLQCLFVVNPPGKGCVHV